MGIGIYRQFKKNTFFLYFLLEVNQGALSFDWSRLSLSLFLALSLSSFLPEQAAVQTEKREKSFEKANVMSPPPTPVTPTPTPLPPTPTTTTTTTTLSSFDHCEPATRATFSVLKSNFFTHCFFFISRYSFFPAYTSVCLGLVQPCTAIMGALKVH